MRRIVLVIATLVAAVVPARALPVGLPPEAGGALASDNVEFIANVPDIPAIGARFIGDTMYVTTYQGVRIYDVSQGIPVPVGLFELPHIENEDVDTNGEILLLGVDHYVSVANVLYVIDVSNPRAPLLLSRFTTTYRAHTASCINDCQYAWLAGSSGRIAVVDLRDPAKPVLAGTFNVPASGITHDVQVDAAGIAWISAAGGIFGYDTSVSAVTPTLVAGRTRSGAGDNFVNRFILHNSLRPDATAMDPSKLGDANVDQGEVVLVTEEMYSDSSCTEEGNFQTGWYHTVDGSPTITKLDSYNVGQGTGGTPPDAKSSGLVTSCSSHYFDFKDGVAAVGWYQQGVRFLDVSDPTDIRSIGYFMPAFGETWAAYFHNGYVYAPNLHRGIDVIRFTGSASSPTVAGPLSTRAASLSMPSPTFGFACRIPVA